MTRPLGQITQVNGNLVTVRFDGAVSANEVAYVLFGDRRLKSEVIRIQKDQAVLQVYEETRGLSVGQSVEFSGDLLSVALGPGLLGQIFDGLQNPLPELAREFGYFLPIGADVPALDPDRAWEFTPAVSAGDTVTGGRPIGAVSEGLVPHPIMVPFDVTGTWTVASIVREGPRTIHDEVAVIEHENGRQRSVTLHFFWPVRVPVTRFRRRLLPDEPLVTGIRIIDTLFPVAKGGTYCVPGPFGAGKTVLQQITARHARVDVVIIAACGERAGEVVETLTEFPKLEDPRTGRPLMERTIIVANTSSMPVASRESSVYTAVTIAEYYRQMGKDVLLLADSTSRWAQAMREISGRLEEIPGEEAYPAYLESRIASFYERAGKVVLDSGEIGSVTIGGTVSPAGGTFEEPVTQATLKVVGAFHGLSRDRANARRFPSIDPLESWSTYPGVIDRDQAAAARDILARGAEAEQMMKVVGEEGTSIEDFVVYLKAEFFDQAYLMQNAFDEVDAATGAERQKLVFDVVRQVLDTDFGFEQKPEALRFFQDLQNAFVNLNTRPWPSEAFDRTRDQITGLIDKAGQTPSYGVFPE